MTEARCGCSREVERLISHFLCSIEGSFLEVTSQEVSLIKRFNN